MTITNWYSEMLRKRRQGSKHKGGERMLGKWFTFLVLTGHNKGTGFKLMNLYFLNETFSASWLCLVLWFSLRGKLTSICFFPLFFFYPFRTRKINYRDSLGGIAGEAALLFQVFKIDLQKSFYSPAKKPTIANGSQNFNCTGRVWIILLGRWVVWILHRNSLQSEGGFDSFCL